MSDKTIDDDDTLRAMLAARTPGEWAPYCDEGPIRYRYLAPDGDGWTYSVCVGGHDDDHTCVLTATGPDVATARANAALAATAPALAAEVLRLRGMLRAASGALAATRDDVQRLRAERDVAISRRSYDARDVAPTPEEIIAHESRGGLWLILSVGRRYHVMQVTRHTLAMDVMPHKWIALDADFMPCAWPVGGGQ